MVPTPLGRVQPRIPINIDEIAYCELAQRLSCTSSALELQRNDLALTALVSGRPRRATGLKLADNLRRNAIKSLMSKPREISLSSAANVSAPGRPLCLLEQSELRTTLHSAALLVRETVIGLPVRQRTALLFKIENAPFELVEHHLRVGKRQYDKLVAAARKAINSSVSASGALVILLGGFAKDANMAREVVRSVLGRWLGPQSKSWEPIRTAPISAATSNN